MSRRIMPALAAAALALGIAACGIGGDGPVTTPPPTMGNGTSDGGGSESNPSDGGGAETEEPTAAAPDVTAPDPADYPGMDEETPEGAEQALRYYIAVVYWGYQTGDTETLENLYSDNCEQCIDIRDEIVEIDNSELYQGSSSITDVDVLNFESPNFDIEIGYGFGVSAHSTPGTSGEDTEVPKTFYTAISGLNWSQDHWVIGDLELRESENA